jgi:hypothetical protein
MSDYLRIFPLFWNVAEICQLEQWAKDLKTDLYDSHIFDAKPTNISDLELSTNEGRKLKVFMVFLA